MSPAPTATTALEPDREQMALFLRTAYKHALPGTFVSLRVFGGGDGRLIDRRSVKIVDDDFESLIDHAYQVALGAIRAEAVFSPPVATFKGRKYAREIDLAEGLCVAVELDEHPRKALATLSALIGPPTMVVESGGRWLNPETGKTEPKLHLYWIFKTPARDEARLTKSKQARELACEIVGADASNKPHVHPLRLPGSWHLKDPTQPRLCRIVGKIGPEIDLDEAFDVLRDAAPDVVVNRVRNVKHTTKPAKPRNAFQEFASQASALADIKTLSEAMQFVPNPDVHWNVRNTVGLALFRSTGGSDEGYRLFVQFSKRSKEKYDEAETRDRWENYKRSPPDRIGPGYIYKLAMENGWRCSPTHAIAQFSSLDVARADLARVLEKFQSRNSIWHLIADEWCGPAALALPIDTGIGKSTSAVAALSAYVKRTGKLVYYAVPRLELADEIAKRFAGHGINARVFRGRLAPDPDSPGDAMCLETEKVEEAVKAKLDISKSCCKKGNEVCPKFDLCGYQRQTMITADVEVWIFAADLLFHRQEKLRAAGILVIDESFWQKQLRGIDDKERVSVSLPLDHCESGLKTLGDWLSEQRDDGGLQLKWVNWAAGAIPFDHEAERIRAEEQKRRERRGDEIDRLDDLIRRQWDRIKDETERLTGIGPSLSGGDFKKRIGYHDNTLKRIAYAHLVRRLLEELRHMLVNGIEISGRLLWKTDEQGRREIALRGVAKITKQFRIPTLVLDATLPDIEILRMTHPRITLKPEVRVAYPGSVHIRQVLDAPTEKGKLITGEASENHREEVLRYILQRWIETGRKPSLVIVNIEYEEWLKGTLPREIAVAHFNDIAGLDIYKDVRLLILIGRPAPGPAAVESIAGALSGSMPSECLAGDDGEFVWYPSVRRGIRLKDGDGVAVMGDQHPDELCESIRRQITEAELLQSIGRGRAVNRTPESPLDIDLLFDTVLPVTVDSCDRWQRPSRYVTTAIDDGVMLESPDDMVKLWPALWTNRKAAARTIARGIPDLPGYETVHYQLAGRRQKIRSARFDRSRHPDPGAWLQARLGPVSVKGKRR